MSDALELTSPEQRECCPAPALPGMGAARADALAATLRALADPLRVQIVEAILNDPRGETCVCDLAHLGEVSQPTFSHHLKKLKEAGLLTSQRRGSWVYYQVAQERAEALRCTLTCLGEAV